MIRPLGGLLGRSSRRHLARHPLQIGLSALGVAIGVAVVVAIRLANAAAERGFELSTATVAGRATHQVVGGPSGLPEDVYRRLRVERGIRPAAPVVEGFVVAGGRTLRLLGVDPLAEGPFRSYAAPAPGGSALGALLTRPGAVLLLDATARELDLSAGVRFDVEVGAATRTLSLAGLLAPDDALSRRALADLLVCDIAVAQELLGLRGRLTRIDLIAPGGAAEGPWLERVRGVLPADAELSTTTARSRALSGMTRAFRLNLQALSLLALLCGGFLIYNTVVFSVVQRRPLIGLLRAVGVTRAEIFRLVLGEAARVAVVGTALGLLLGVVLGQGLVRLVTRTINDLYFVLTVRGAPVDGPTLVLGGLLGLGATLVAALAPAFEATLAPPRATLTRSVIEERVRRGIPRAAAAGLAVALAGGALLALPSRSLLVAFAALFAIVFGCALATPLALVVLMRAAGPAVAAAGGAIARMAARGVVAALSRTAVAVAALTIAVSVTVGVGVMVSSFRQAVVRWLEMTLVADVYASPAGSVPHRTDPPIDPAAVARIVALPGIERVHTLRRVVLETGEGTIALNAVAMSSRGERAFDFTDGDPAAAWPAFHRGEAVIVSEPFAWRSGIGAGGTLTLRTAGGPRAFRVVGVFTSYGSDQGVVMIDRAAYRTLWEDDAVSALALFAVPGVDADDLAGRVRRAAGGGQALTVQSNRALREASLEVFDRTFTITAVLRLLVALVAFIGVATALLALQLERARELGVLRATGMTPAQVGRLVTLQTALTGLAAGLLALPVGLVQAALMIHVINRRSFGWTMPMSVEPTILAGAVALALAAALLAGAYPAWRMARTSPALALREE